MNDPFETMSDAMFGLRDPEPNYDFVPGKGWVLEEYAYESITWKRNGHTCKLTLRNPKPGERFFCMNQGDTLTYVKSLLDATTFRRDWGGEYDKFPPTPMEYFKNTQFCVIQVS